MHDNRESLCDIISCSVLCRPKSVGERTNFFLYTRGNGDEMFPFLFKLCTDWHCVAPPHGDRYHEKNANMIILTFSNKKMPLLYVFGF